jgi:hypothetical protein
MNLEYAKLIVEASDPALKPFDVRLRTDYSGRGMFGATTAAIVAPDIAEFAATACKAVARLAQHGNRTAGLINAVRNVRIDHMGNDVVIY